MSARRFVGTEGSAMLEYIAIIVALNTVLLALILTMIGRDK